MEYAAEMWWIRGQMKMGRRLLRANNTVAGVAVQGDLGWRMLEGRDDSHVW